MIEFLKVFLIILPFWIASVVYCSRKAYLNGVDKSVGRYLQGIQRADIPTTNIITKRPQIP